MLQRVPLLRSGAAAAETAKIVAKTMITLFILINVLYTDKNSR